MKAKMLCYPPLGQPTLIPAGQDSVDFTVVLETSDTTASNSTKQWQVALWHDLDSDNGEWHSAIFEESDGIDDVVSCVLSRQLSNS